jgi:hypothetical protein
MVNIYCITDCNGLKYVGSTRQTILKRLSNHRNHKNNNYRYCSSFKLDLDNCEIEVLEECEPEIRYEREKYYINTIDCVNEIKFTFDMKEYKKKYNKQYNEKNREKKNKNAVIYQKQFYVKNKDKIKQYQKQYREKNKEKRKEYDKLYREYKISWGDMLKIDVNLFQ